MIWQWVIPQGETIQVAWRGRIHAIICDGTTSLELRGGPRPLRLFSPMAISGLDEQYSFAEVANLGAYVGYLTIIGEPA